MTPERFRQVRDVAGAALDRPQAERAAFLVDACAGNDGLRADVDTLLAAYEEVRGSSFLETPAAELASTGPLTAGEEDPLEGALLPGTRLGAYEIGDALGRGGMGIVYRAVRADDEYRQVVAIKVIQRGMDTAAGQRRFREERQILASLDHPGIARLLDGGTTEGGLPYFVMEYVEGEAIDAYCDRRRLAVAERLRLFIQVCAAVHHAHRSLVVHRDLKPGNVLVTAEGVPKLLDFGIARLLRPAGEPGVADPTVTVLRMLTPDYASPEQVKGQPVTTATDVYSLGVLLYELLSGQRPYRTGLAHEVMAAICETDPERPSAAVARTDKATAAEGSALLRKRLTGDLDTIVLKAMRKAPGERYASVEAFADDITRHLEGRPVRARPHTLAYRAGKFLRRNPAAAAAAGLALAALLGGIVATTRQARIAEANRRRAERRFNDVRKIAHTMMFDVHDAIETLPGSTAPRKLLVAQALAYLDGLAAEAGDDASLQRELATGYQKMGDVLGQSNAPNLGDVPGALKAYAKAQAARERLLAREPDNVELLRDLSTTWFRMSRAFVETGEHESGVEHARRATLIEERLLALDHGPAQRFRQAKSISNHGWLLYVAGHTLESARRLRESIALLEPLASSPTAPAEFKANLGSTYGFLARTLANGNPPQGIAPDLPAAMEWQRKSLAIYTSLAAEAPSDRVRQRNALVTRMQLGQFLQQAGDMKAARELFREGFAATERLARTDAADVNAQRDVGWAAMTLGDLLARNGSPEEALTVLGRAAQVQDAVLAADPTNETTRSQRARTIEGFGHAHAALASDRRLSAVARLGHWRDARSRFEEARAYWQEAQDKGIASAVDTARLEAIRHEIAKCDAALGGAAATARQRIR